MFSKRKGMDGGRERVEGGGLGARERKQLPILSCKNIKDVCCDPVVRGKRIESVVQHYSQIQREAETIWEYIERLIGSRV